jgi:hypothetical protein
VFYVSQLKPFIVDYSPVYSKLSDIPTLDVIDVTPERILDRRLVKKGNVAITQILVQWNRLPESSTTWEDFMFSSKGFLQQLSGDRQVFRGGQCHGLGIKEL